LHIAIAKEYQDIKYYVEKKSVILDVEAAGGGETSSGTLSESSPDL
jgi:hypothetical protein